MKHVHTTRPFSGHLGQFSNLLLLALFLAACASGGDTVPGSSGPNLPRPGGLTPHSQTPTQSGELGQIRIVNKASHVGLAVAEVVVPLKKGAFFTTPNVRTEYDKVCQVFAMGAPHDDGSIRYLRLEVPVDSTANQTQTLQLKCTDGPNPEFIRHSSISGITGITARFLASGDTVHFPSGSLIAF